MKKICLQLLLCLLSLTLLPGASRGAGPVYQDGVLAVVGDTVITGFQLRQETAILMRSMGGAYSEADLEKRYSEMAKAVLDRLIERELYWKEFQARDLDVPEALLQSRLDQIVLDRSGGNKERFREQLEEQGMTLKEVEENLRKNLAAELMREQFVQAVEQPTPKEISAYYHANYEDFHKSSRMQIQALVVEPQELKEAALKLKLEDLRKRMEDPETLQAAAEAPDVDSIQFGWVEPEDLQTEFGEAVKNLEKGETSEPVRFDGKIYLLRVLDREKGTTVELDAETRERIRRQILGSRAREQEQKFLDKLRKKFFVKAYSR